MKFNKLAAALTVVMATGANAQDSDSPYVTFRVLKPELAFPVPRAAITMSIAQRPALRRLKMNLRFNATI